MLFLLVISDPERRDKLTELYQKYKQDVFIKAYSILKDRELSEDMVHDTFIRVCKHLDKIEDIYSNRTRSFLVIIVKNLCIDYIRKRTDKLTSTFEEISYLVPDTEDTPEDVVLNMELTKEMTEYLSKLNESYAEVINLRYYQGFSSKEIAEILNISYGNVRVRLKRALEALKKMMEEREVVYE